MAAAKKPAARKPAAKKKASTSARSASKAKAVAPVARAMPAVREKMTKTAILTQIAEATHLSRSQVDSVLEELGVLIERHIKKRAVGEFTLPGLMKIKAAKRPATKKRKGRNPATGEEITISAKPASVRVRVTPLKKLKDMVI